MALKIATATRAYPGERLCGDACGFWHTPDKVVLALCDGLGHGDEASVASQAAIKSIGMNLESSCEEIFACCDIALRKTRGAALAVATVNLNCNELTIGTVGNIRALLLRPEKDLRLGGARGIVGAGFTHLKPETIPIRKGDILTLFSDGFDEFLPIRKVIEGHSTEPEALVQHMINQLASPDDDAGILMYQHE